MSRFARVTHSPGETLELGRRLGERLPSIMIVTLDGDLGAGKTWFAKGIAYGAGVPDHEYVNSPAYDLIHEYQGRVKIYHLDLYRLERMELDDMEMLRELYSQGVCLIEWSTRLKNAGGLYPQNRLAVTISPLPSDPTDGRLIEAEIFGTLPAEFVNAVEDIFA